MSTDYGHMSTVELEDLLRRPNLTLADLQSVRAELTRRYCADADVRLPLPRLVPTPSPSRPVFEEAADTEKAIVRTVLALILVLAVGIGLVVYFVDEKPAPQQPAYGNTCMAAPGPCPLTSPPLLVGSPCSCNDGIRDYPGTVR